jgi:hypothetical protein
MIRDSIGKKKMRGLDISIQYISEDFEAIQKITADMKNAKTIEELRCRIPMFDFTVFQYSCDSCKGVKYIVPAKLSPIKEDMGPLIAGDNLLGHDDNDESSDGGSEEDGCGDCDDGLAIDDFISAVDADGKISRSEFSRITNFDVYTTNSLVQMSKRWKTVSKRGSAVDEEMDLNPLRIEEEDREISFINRVAQYFYQRYIIEDGLSVESFRSKMDERDDDFAQVPSDYTPTYEPAIDESVVVRPPPQKKIKLSSSTAITKFSFSDVGCAYLRKRGEGMYGPSRVTPEMTKIIQDKYTAGSGTIKGLKTSPYEIMLHLGDCFPNDYNLPGYKEILAEFTKCKKPRKERTKSYMELLRGRMEEDFFSVIFNNADQLHAIKKPDQRYIVFCIAYFTKNDVVPLNYIRAIPELLSPVNRATITEEERCRIAALLQEEFTVENSKNCNSLMVKFISSNKKFPALTTMQAKLMKIKKTPPLDNMGDAAVPEVDDETGNNEFHAIINEIEESGS